MKKNNNDDKLTITSTLADCKRPKQRYYSAEIILYNNIDYLRVVLARETFIRNYAFIVHDKDVKEDGEPKKVHCHLFATFFQNLSFDNIAKKMNELSEAFNVLPENISKIKGSLTDCYKYLTHENAPDKHPYDKSLIVTNNVKAFNGDNATEQDLPAYQLLDDILRGDMSFRELARKYGREVILNYDKYYKYSLLVRTEDKARENQERVDMEKLMQTPCKRKLLLVDEHGEIIKQI